MEKPEAAHPRKVVFLFTTFPVISETFLQREVGVFREAGLPMQIVSLWGGDSRWQGLPVERAGLLTSLSGILWIPWWLVKRPRVIVGLFRSLWRPRRSGFLNWMENLLGAGYALRAATRWSGERVAHFHGVWASAPGMAGLVLSELCDTPFSLSGHAYDLFERGGDGWLREKARSAQWVRTSTEVGRKRLLEIGVDEAKVLLVRRGLPERPPFDPEKAIGSPCRIVSVGRMVTKMGFDRQIPLYAALKQAGFLFRVDWIGDGPERSRLEQEVDRAGLSDLIRFRGRLPYEEVETFYQRGDIFVFTGRIDCNGDRAGLPNAIAEAMAWGLPVFATDVGAVGEAVRHAQTGFLWPGNPAAEDILDALANPANLSTCRQQAYQWVENMFDSRTNLAPLLRRFSGVTFCRPEG